MRTTSTRLSATHASYRSWTRPLIGLSLVMVTLLLTSVGILGPTAAVADESPSPSTAAAAEPPVGLSTSAPDASTGDAVAVAPSGPAEASEQPLGPSAAPPATTAGPSEVSALPVTDTAATQPPTTAEASVREPRATIGQLDCVQLTVIVTMDNTRSTEAVKFEVQYNTFDDEAFIENFQVDAGASLVEPIPVPDHTSLWLLVADDDLYNSSEGEEGILAEAEFRISCKPDARGAFATIGELDCSALVIPVTLDNSRATAATKFLVISESGEGDEGEELEPQRITVAAGETRIIQLAVRDHSGVFVYVADADIPQDTDEEDFGEPLAQAAIDVSCTIQRHAPSVRVGRVNCTTLSVPVTLDNTRSDDLAAFALTAIADVRGGLSKAIHEVDPGHKVVVHVPTFNSTTIELQVFDLASEGPRGEPAVLFDDSIDAACAASRPASRSTPAVAVLFTSSQLPETGGLDGNLPIAALAFLVCGGALMWFAGHARPGVGVTRQAR